MDFGAISRNFKRKILRPRKIFENFGRKSAPNRTESHAQRHADALHTVWTPLWVKARLQHVKHSGFWRNLAQFRTQSFATVKNLRNFRSKFAPQCMPPGGAQLAHGLQRSPTAVPSVGMLRRESLRAIRCGFPTEIFEKNFAAAKVCIRNRVRSHQIPRTA